MTRFITLSASAALLCTIMSWGASAQGTIQNVSLPNANPADVAAGYRTSKMVGSKVINDEGVTIGKIDDLIVTPSETVPFAILSVGGFLGIDSKYVVVATSSLVEKDHQMLLKGGTKAALEALPAYKYTN